MKPGRVAQSDAQLLIASIVASGTAAAFLALVERHLGTDGFEPVAQLWNMWAISAAFLTISLQLGTIGTRGNLAAMLNPRLLGSMAALAVAFSALALAFNEQLFGTTSLVWPLLALCIPIGAALMGVTRGFWSSLGRFGRTAAVIGSENVIRLIVGIVCVATAASTGWFGLAILIGFAPVLFTPWRQLTAPVDSDDAMRANAVTSAAALAALLAFTTFSAAPTVIAIAGGADRLSSAAFVALVLARLPQGLMQGVVPRLSVTANDLATAGEEAKLISWQRQLAFLVVLGGPIAAAIGSFFMGPIAGLLFSEAAKLSQLDYGLAAMSALLNIALVGQIILLAARRRTRTLTWSWLAAIPVVVVALLFSDLATPRSVFLTGCAVQLVMLAMFVLVTPKRSVTS